MFAIDVVDGARLTELSMEDAIAAAREINGRDPSWFRSLQYAAEEVLNVYCRHAFLRAIGILANLSAAVRRRLSRDFEFLDCLAMRISDSGLLVQLMLVFDPAHPLLDAEEWAFLKEQIKLLVTVVISNPKPWIAHSRLPGRTERFLPLIGDLASNPPPNEDGSPGLGFRYGSLVHQLMELTTLVSGDVTTDQKKKEAIDSMVFFLAGCIHEFIALFEPKVRRNHSNDAFKGAVAAFTRSIRGHEAPAVCDHCHKEPPSGQKLQRCARCRIAWYCGPDDQRAAWKEHKAVCFEAK
jgi:hypothetical protein